MGKIFYIGFTIFLMIFIILENGINIENIEFSDYKIQKLSLTMDEKFHLKIEKLEILKISPSKNNPFLDSIIAHDEFKIFLNSLICSFANISINRLTFYDLKGKLDLKITNHKIYFKYKSEKNSIDNFFGFLKKKLNKKLSRWIIDALNAENFEIKSLSGEFDIKKQKIKNLKALIEIEKLSYHFVTAHPPIQSKKTVLKYQNNQIEIFLHQAKYRDKNLQNSKVIISNLDKKRVNIDIFLQTKTLFDKKIKNLLLAYDVKIPIMQIEGKNFVDVKLMMKTSPFKFNFDVKLDIKKAKFEKYPILINQATIFLNSNRVKIEDLNFKYQNIINLWINGRFNLKTLNYFGNIWLENILYNSNDFNIVNLKNIFTNTTFIKIEDIYYFNFNELEIIGKLSKNSSSILIPKISKVLSNEFLEKFNLIDGRISLNFVDIDNLKSQIFMNFSSFPINQNSFLFNIQKFKDKIDIREKSNNINILIDEKKIIANLQNYTFNIKKMKKLLRSLPDTKSQKPITRKKSQKIEINCKNFAIKIDENITLPFQKIKIDKNNDILKLIANNRLMNIYILKIDNFVKLEIKNLSSEYLKKNLNLDTVQKGSIDLKTSGVIGGTFGGKIWAKNLIIKDFKIKKVFSNFLYNEENLTLKNIDIDSIIKITGGGLIELKKKKINLKLTISYLHSLANFLRKVPILGYVILGDEKYFYTNVIISGDLRNPTIDTQIAEDLLKIPFYLIYRIFKLPLRVF